MPIDEIIKRISDSILKGIEKDSKEWATDMETKYPKWKGSRILKKDENSVTFGFDNDHADKLQVGSPAKPVTGIYTHRVKSHNRKQGRSKQRVRQHNKVYKNHIPVKLPDGQWRMVSKIPEVKATQPISKSVMKRLTGKAGETLLADAIKQEFESG